MTASNPNRSTNILFVDDDELEAHLLRRAFKTAGITSPLWVASNGEQALEMLRGSVLPVHRRLVLLDQNMPRMNGIETLREIRQDPTLNDLSVVMLTTSSDPRDKARAYSLNVAGYLVKPLNPGIFAEMMSALIHYWSLVEFP